MTIHWVYVSAEVTRNERGSLYIVTQPYGHEPGERYWLQTKLPLESAATVGKFPTMRAAKDRAELL